MTPFIHQTNNEYVRAYQAEVHTDIQTSRLSPNLIHTMRRHIAQSLVRAGAWLLPDKTDVIRATVSLLSRSQIEQLERKAA
jgi:hypothetical protein